MTDSAPPATTPDTELESLKKAVDNARQQVKFHMDRAQRFQKRAVLAETELKSLRAATSKRAA